VKESAWRSLRGREPHEVLVHGSPSRTLLARLTLPHGHAVNFPDAKAIKGAFPAHAPLDVWITSGDLGRLEGRVAGILEKYAREPAAPLNDERAQAALDALLLSFRVVPCVGVRLRGQEEAQVRLTEQQWTALEQMDENRQLVVKGVAGSGKMLLALEKAARLAREGAPGYRPDGVLVEAEGGPTHAPGCWSRRRSRAARADRPARARKPVFPPSSKHQACPAASAGRR
jgi:hypothetical protein